MLPERYNSPAVNQHPPRMETFSGSPGALEKTAGSASLTLLRQRPVRTKPGTAQHPIRMEPSFSRDLTPRVLQRPAYSKLAGEPPSSLACTLLVRGGR